MKKGPDVGATRYTEAARPPNLGKIASTLPAAAVSTASPLGPPFWRTVDTIGRRLQEIAARRLRDSPDVAGRLREITRGQISDEGLRFYVTREATRHRE